MEDRAGGYILWSGGFGVLLMSVIRILEVLCFVFFPVEVPFKIIASAGSPPVLLSLSQHDSLFNLLVDYVMN